jgi:sulfide:quinone oxidoreductase
MTHRVVILGGGTGGTLTANRLRGLYPGAVVDLTVVDQDDRHVYQPGLLFVPFGLAHPEDIVRPRSRQRGRRCAGAPSGCRDRTSDRWWRRAKAKVCGVP